jgi:isopenicillin-N epimerase
VTVPAAPAPIPGARLLFSLDPAVAHLNHGSFGAVPIPVQRAQQRLRDEEESNPMRFRVRGLLDRIAHTRRHIAAFLGATDAADPGAGAATPSGGRPGDASASARPGDASASARPGAATPTGARPGDAGAGAAEAGGSPYDGTALLPNVTAAVSIVLDSVDLRPGDEVVTTDHAYGAVAIATTYYCERAGATHRVVALPLTPTDDEVVDAVRRALTGHTRLVIIDQITSETARVFPVARVAAVARQAGAAVFVDGAHVPGQLHTRVAEIGADFWAGNLHKWAYAPRGTALLAVAPPWRARIRPPAVSWWQPDGFPTSVDYQGTVDYSPWLAAPTGLFALRTLGLDAVRAHNAALARYGQAVVGTALGLKPADLPTPPPGLAMAVVPLPPGIAGDLDDVRHWRQRIADELAAEVAIVSWRGRGLLRLSAQVYNRADEYERLAERLPALLRTR